MTDKKFTDDEIVKALECCGGQGCKECPFNCNCATCIMTLQDSALALINRQKASLQEVITLNSKLEAENAKLQRLLDFYEETSGNKKAKAEAIKEFAQRLKSDLGRIPQYHFTRSQVEWSIDTLVKEMTEENK